MFRSRRTNSKSNIGVLQTTVAELVTVKEHQRELPQHRDNKKTILTWNISSSICRYAVGLVHWVSRVGLRCAVGGSPAGSSGANDCGSSIVGPMIGGALAKPVDNLPSVFAPGSIWDRFPYLLPNLFSAICVSVGVVIGLLFLEETHTEKKQHRDRGVEFGNYLISYVLGKRGEVGSPAKNAEEQPLLFETEEPLPGYLTNGSPAGSSTAPAGSEQEPIALEEAASVQVLKTETKTTTRIFTKPVLTIIASYGILAL